MFVYTPNVGFSGKDTMEYRICDNGAPSLCDTGMVVITVNPTPIISASVSSLNNCSGDTVSITFNSNVGGTSFTWTGSNGTSGTDEIQTSLSNAGTSNIVVTYTVIGTARGGCGSNTLSIPVTVKPRPIVSFTQNNTIFCSGDQVVVNLSSNIAGTTYTWTGSNGSSGSGNIITDNPVNNGTSNITVTYTVNSLLNGCSGTPVTISVTVKPKPVLSTDPPSQIVCSGTPITITISSTVPGTSINWTASNGNSGNTSTINDSPINFTGSTIVVTYTVNGQFNGCAANTTTATVTVRPKVNTDAGQDKSVTACSASCVTIGGSPTGSGGSGTLTYSWNPILGLSSQTAANPTACNIASTTNYIVTVTDASGCSATDAMTITVTPSSLTAEAGAGGALCLGSGDSVMLGGFPTAVGGTPAYTYTWAPSGLNLTNPANPWAFPTSTTRYYLTVTDALGCTSVDSTLVVVYPQLFANAGTDAVVCAGFNATLGGSPTAIAGSGSGFTYAWSPTLNVSNTAVSNPIATPTTTTSYVVTVIDGNGCHASDTVQIVVNPSPTAHAGIDKSLAQCPGDSVILGENPAATGGTAPFTYSWTPTTGFVTASNIPNPVVKGLSASVTYTLSVVDANGCSSTDLVLITVTPNTLQAQAGPDEAICSGLNSCVQIGGLPTAVGGYPPYSFAWSNSGSLTNATSGNPLACPISTTTYTLTLTDSKGCTATDAETVTVNPSPTANAGPDTSACAGSSVIIGGSPSATGGTPGYTYSWTPTPGLSLPNIANPAASPIVVTTYQLIVVDNKGCSSLDEVTVTPRTNPIADAGSDKILVNCSGDSTFIGGLPTTVGGGTPPYSCVWAPAFGLSDSTTCNPTVAGTTLGLGSHSYQLIVKDLYGCVGVDYMIVDVIPSTLQANAGNNGSLCSNAGSTITIGGNPTAVGGSAPFNFTWASSPGIFTSGLANPQVSPTVTTTYYVTVMDSKGCTSTDSVKVIIHPAPSANAGTDTTLCSGFCVNIGSAATGFGGTAPYQYLWSPTVGLSANNTANPLACPLVTTTYNVQVTDSNGCIINEAVTVTVRPVPVANAGVDASMTTCSGDSVRIGGSPAASGGTPGYTYSWNPAAGLYPDSTVTNPWVKGIASSQLYTLVVTDANGCTAEDAVAVTVVSSTLTVDAGNNSSYCSGSGSSATLGGGTTAIGGYPAYTFSWSPSTGLSSTTVAHPVANPTVTTKYYVTVTDSKGCIAVDSVRVIVNPSPIADAGNDTAVCSGKPVILGGNPTAVSAGQGNGIFSYNWSPGVGLSSTTASNPKATTTVTTTYTVTISDENGCSASDGIQITIRENPIADAGPDKTLVACSADSVRLGGSPTASNGGGTYTYSWTPGTNPPLSNGTLPNPYASHLGSTTSFTVVVTDQFGCSAQDQVAVQVTNPTLIASAGNDVSFCQGASVSVTLGSTPTALGGTLPYTYSWSPGATLTPDSIRANPVATPTATTTYTVVVRDATGCIASDTVRITINPRPVVSAGLPDTICAGECLALGGSPTASGGTGSYSYNWTPSLFITSSTTIDRPTACPTSPITYQVTATDSLGCSNTASISIRVNQNPVANAGVDKSLVACPEACATIGSSPTASGGGGGYLYAWAPSAGLNNTGLSNPSACNLLQSVTYNLTVTDANGCTAVDQMLVSVTQSTLRADAGADKSICAGTTNCVSIGGINSVSGATGSYVIDWSPTGGICNASNIPNPLVNPTDTTTYVLLVTDSLGCVAIDSMTLFANPAVTASVAPDTAICQGGSALLGGYPTGSGGTPTYTYAWSGGTLTNPTSGNPTASPLSTTSYCVTVTDVVGCSSSTCQTVTVNPAVCANAGPDQAMLYCPGSFLTIGGSPSGACGSGNYSYQWTPDSVGGVLVVFGATIPNPIITGLTVTTVFTLKVTDNATGCYATDQVKITVNQSTLAVDAGPDRTFCSNSASCILIGGSPTANGGVFPYTYQWAPIGGLNDATIANPCGAPINTTMYHLTVYDNLGCFREDSMTVVVSPLIAVNAGNDTIICSNSSVLLGSNPSAVGGTGTYTYQWSPSSFLTSTIASNPTAQNVTSNMTYALKVTDSLGCSASDIINIGVRALPIANAGANAVITACSTDSAVLGGLPTGSGTTPPYTYSWNPPVALNSSTVSNPVVSQLGNTTQYCVVVTDSFGCASVPSCATVTVLPVSIIVDAGATQSLCSNLPTCVTLGGATPVSGGFGPYTYTWLGGALPTNIDHPTACPLATTTYTLVVTDNNGCQSSDTVQVIVNQPTETNISGLNSSYCINSGNVVMTGIPAGGTFSGPFVTGNVFQPTATGFWCITYRYTNPSTGCVDDTVICVTVNPLPVVTASGFNANYCRYDAPFTITGSPSGGTFSGSPGVDSLGVFTPANATVGNNVITYTYLDEQTGCSNTYTFTINVKDAPTLDLSATNDTVCLAGCVTIDATYSLDVFNISYTQIGGGNVHSGLGSWTYCPTLTDVSIVGTAVNTPNGCITRDTLTFHVNQPPVALYDEASTCEEIQVFIPELSNDSDPEVDNNNVTIISTGHGNTTVGNGLLIYTPAANFSGTDTILYLLCNTNCPNSCDTGTVVVTVCPVNDPPVILDTTITIYENDTADVCPFIFDLDGDALIISDAQCAPLNGTIVMTSDSCFEFVPTPGWTGTQVLCIAVCDPSGLCDTATIIINVIGINHRPHAVKVNTTVCVNTSIGINVSAGAGDIDGDPLNFSYLAATSQPAGSTYALTVTGNGAVVFSGTTPGYYHIPYIVCDQTNRFPGSLCDTDEIIVRVIICDSLNEPPVANDDYTTTTVGTSTTINELANDFDPDGDSLNVTLLCPPTLAGATASVNPNGTINYSSPIVGVDSICYIICDPYNACDTAVVYIFIDSTTGVNHPPVAVDDFDSTDYVTPVTVHVLTNDHDPDGNLISIIVSIPCPPLYGTATVNGNVITYIPGPNANANQPDTFCYVIQDIYGAYDTAYVVIFIKNSVQAVNDTVQTGNYVPITIDVMNNDFDPESDSFYVTSVITNGTVGTVTLNADGTVTYIPQSDTCGFVDSFQYTVQDVLGAVDTATVYITIICCPLPVAVLDSAIVISGDSLLINPTFNDTGANLTVAVVTAPLHGTATVNANGVVTYKPASGYCGYDTLAYSIANPCGADTALIIVNVSCNLPPNAIKNSLTMCVNDTACVDVLANDNDPDGNTLTITGLSTPFPSGLGNITGVNGGSICFQSGTVAGTFSLNYYVCDNGIPSKCDTAILIVRVVPCTLVHADTIYGTTCLNTADTICAGNGITGTNNPTITTLCSSQNGAATLVGGNCIAYSPNSGFIGRDTFCMVVCDTLGHCDTSAVVLTTVDCLIQAVDEPCDLDTAYMNNPITIDVLANDIIPFGGDTSVVLLSNGVNGTAVVNADYTVTYTPNVSFKGTESFVYQVCVITGTDSFCARAKICVTVVDTTVECYIPNGFSPNGDGVNEEFTIPCNSRYPNSTLRIFNRWGVEVWFSEGAYQNDFAGKNKQGIALPDGTYYLIYEYNDGTGKREAKFVVINR
ncbi:MAG: Ig-like domain-containing protein [Bacteroidetes bacterium]|nr:Ig-like domain-containing protein [Bacteroidota bacterium]